MNNYHYCFPCSGISTLLQLHKLQWQSRLYGPHDLGVLGKHATFGFLVHSTVEVERRLLRNNNLIFLLIKNEYIYTKPKT